MLGCKDSMWPGSSSFVLARLLLEGEQVLAPSIIFPRDFMSDLYFHLLVNILNALQITVTQCSPPLTPTLLGWDYLERCPKHYLQRLYLLGLRN